MGGISWGPPAKDVYPLLFSPQTLCYLCNHNHMLALCFCCQFSGGWHQPCSRTPPVQRRLQRRSEVEEPTKPWYLTSSEHITAFQPPETQPPGRVLGLLPVIANLKPSSHINKENRSSFRAGSLPLHRFSCQPHHHLLDLSPSFLPALDDPSSPHMSSMKLSLASTWPCTECFRMMLRSFSRSCSCSHFPFSRRLDCLCPLWFFPFSIFCSL